MSIRVMVALLAVSMFAVAASPADARHRSHHRTHHKIHHFVYPTRAGDPVCDNNGRCVQSAALIERAGSPEARAGDPSAAYEGRVVGGRPAGCPHAFCGCEASRYVFGTIRPELNLASNWIRKFPRAAPAAGMAAARSGHVMILISHVGGRDWLVHDGNGGKHKTWEHVRSIAGYVIVDPNGNRMALR